MGTSLPCSDTQRVRCARKVLTQLDDNTRGPRTDVFWELQGDVSSLLVTDVCQETLLLCRHFRRVVDRCDRMDDCGCTYKLDRTLVPPARKGDVSSSLVNVSDGHLLMFAEGIFPGPRKSLSAKWRWPSCLILESTGPLDEGLSRGESCWGGDGVRVGVNARPYSRPRGNAGVQSR